MKLCFLLNGHIVLSTSQRPCKMTQLSKEMLGTGWQITSVNLVSHFAYHYSRAATVTINVILFAKEVGGNSKFCDFCRNSGRQNSVLSAL